MTLRHGRTGQFDHVVDGDVLVTRGRNWLTRMLGAGYPDFEDVLAELEKHIASRALAARLDRSASIPRR